MTWTLSGNVGRGEAAADVVLTGECDARYDEDRARALALVEQLRGAGRGAGLLTLAGHRSVYLDGDVSRSLSVIWTGEDGT